MVLQVHLRKEHSETAFPTAALPASGSKGISHCKTDVLQTPSNGLKLRESGLKCKQKLSSGHRQNPSKQGFGGSAWELKQATEDTEGTEEKQMQTRYRGSRWLAPCIRSV